MADPLTRPQASVAFETDANAITDIGVTRERLRPPTSRLLSKAAGFARRGDAARSSAPYRAQLMTELGDVPAGCGADGAHRIGGGRLHAAGRRLRAQSRRMPRQ